MMGSPLLDELPVLPGLYIDARQLTGHRPDLDRAERGWFDVIPLADGRAAMAVGDVIGPDEPRPLVAHRVRAILTQMLADGHGLEAALAELSTWSHGGDAMRSTLSVAVLDPRSGTVDYCTYDHPPPLVVTADGDTRLLRPTDGKDHSGKLSCAVEQQRLAHDDVLVLHTGAISPAIPPSSTEHVAAQSRTEQVCRAAAAGIRHRGTQQDLAVLAVQMKPRAPRLTLSLPAVAASVAPAKQAVGDWLAALRSSVEDGVGMALAMGEAVTNAIQHAFVGTPPGSVLVECTLLDDGVLVCSVTDDGRWPPAAEAAESPEAAEADRTGRGLRMMARVCDRLQIHRRPSGTVVELRLRLRHPVIRSTA